MSSITKNQQKVNRARAEDAVRRLVEALRELPRSEANDVLHMLVERIELEDATRP